MSKNILDNAQVTGNAWVFGNAKISGNAQVSGNARVFGDAKITGNARVSGNARVFGDAKITGNARVSGNAWVFGNAKISGNAWVSGNARVYGNAWVYGNAMVSGNADIQSNDDWFSLIYQGKTLTGYRSRNDLGYELNIDGISTAIDILDPTTNMYIKMLISKFTPFENKEKTELRNGIKDLQKQLAEAQAKLENMK